MSCVIAAGDEALICKVNNDAALVVDRSKVDAFFFFQERAQEAFKAGAIHEYWQLQERAANCCVIFEIDSPDKVKILSDSYEGFEMFQIVQVISGQQKGRKGLVMRQMIKCPGSLLH